LRGQIPQGSAPAAVQQVCTRNSPRASAPATVPALAAVQDLLTALGRPK
jgi:hypothetical protein